MQNPWLKLPEGAPFILPCDVAAVTRYMQKYDAHPKRRLHLDSLPAPFIGDLRTACVLFLLLNPGHSEADRERVKRPAYRADYFANLRHEHVWAPFYSINPVHTGDGGHSWWTRILSAVLKRVPAKVVARRIAAVEWHPYHSIEGGSARFFRGDDGLPSQAYGFHWVRQALTDPERMVIVMRSSSLWTDSVGSLGRAVRPRNPRNPSISSANLGGKNFAKLLSLVGD